MIYRHEFRVRAPLAAVADFHAQAASMAALTPPPMLVRRMVAPASLATGSQMAFRLWLGPLPVDWTASIEDASDRGFTDRQVRGPFACWVHRHSFVALDAHHTQVRDEVHAEIRRHWLWGPVGLLMWLGMPVLFAYRGWKTARLLDKAA